MSRTLLIECSPRRPADGTVATLRLASKVIGPANQLGVQWEPAITAPPGLESSIGFDGREFGASPTPQVGELAFFLTDRTRAAAGLVWKNAAVTIKMALWKPGGLRPDDGDFTTIWTGRADDISASKGEAKVKLIDNGEALRRPLVITKWGTSGVTLIDSADAVKDRSPGEVVPMAWGRCLSIPGTLVDRANNIWLFSGRPATAVAGFYDGGAAFTTGTARANLAALVANVPARGAVDYVLDAGGLFLARPWDAPNFPFTAAATFGVTRAADIASALVSGRAGPGFTAGTVTALNALQGADCQLYIADETTIAAALDTLLAGLGVIWRLNSAGTIDLIRLAWGSPVLTVPAHRRGAPERLSTILPTAKRAIGYARNYRVHSEAEIAAIVLAEDLSYADGTAIEALKPADAAATSADAVVGNLSLAVNAAGWAFGSTRAYRVAGGAGDPAPGLFEFAVQTAGQAVAAVSDEFKIEPGQKIYVSVQGWRAAGVTAPNFLARIYYKDAAGTQLGPFDSQSIMPTGATVWERWEITGTAPATARTAFIFLFANENTGVLRASLTRAARTQLNADVTVAQPVVSRLSSTSGQAADNFVASDGNSFARIVAAGEARDGDSVSFPATLAGVPRVSFLPGGNAASAGQNIAINAVDLSVTGFTMKAESQAVTVGSTITDTGSGTGSGAEPARVMNRSNSGHPFDNKFIYRFPVNVGLLGGVDPGQIDVAAYAKIGASWVEVARGSYNASGTYELTATCSAVDFGAGNEFGLAAVYTEGSGTALTGFTSVKYALGTTTETSLTPAGASSIPWLAFL